MDHNTDLRTAAAGLEPFVELIGAEQWEKRTTQLIRTASTSPYQRKIITDYHWLEVILAQYIAARGTNNQGSAEQLTVKLASALLFVQTVVSTHSHLSAAGRRRLQGRLQGALKAETGFAPLYAEMSVARRLLDAGYEVEFSDLEGLAQFDLRFWKGSAHGEVECKSLSCDAGRKIHRKDFYRFMDSITGVLESRACSGTKDVLLVTLRDRMPASREKHVALRQAAEELLSRPSRAQVEADFFTVALEAHDPRLELAFTSGRHAAYRFCQEQYGENCHVSGVIAPASACMVVMRSLKEDDTSGALLDAMKRATSQFSRTRPAFIAVQYEDIEPSDLLSHSIRRRAGILSYCLFHHPEMSHLGATYFCAYAGLIIGDEGIGEPAFSIPNPISKDIVATDYVPFLGHLPDAEFARVLGELPPLKSISYIPIDDSDQEGISPAK